MEEDLHKQLLTAFLAEAGHSRAKELSEIINGCKLSSDIPECNAAAIWGKNLTVINQQTDE
jgi:hypothetical protein